MTQIRKSRRNYHPDELATNPSLEFQIRVIPCTVNKIMQRVARKFLIRGEVQGVGYRFFAQRAAARHQIVGYVRNLPDGRVESLAEGVASDVEAFKHELATGPEWAAVTQIEEIVLEPSNLYPSFRIER